MPPGEEEVALKEQLLKKCHITETNSPWNSLLFVIHRKASDTWRLLHDLREIYEVIENLGLLLLGLTSLSMILTDLLVIIDLRLFSQYSTSSRRSATICLFNSKTRTSTTIPLGGFISGDDKFTYYLPMVCGLSPVSSLTEASTSNDCTLHGQFTH